MRIIGTPISIILSVALKNPKSCFGHSHITSMDMDTRAKELFIARPMDSLILSFFLAPKLYATMVVSAFDMPMTGKKANDWNLNITP